MEHGLTTSQCVKVLFNVNLLYVFIKMELPALKLITYLSLSSLEITCPPQMLPANLSADGNNTVGDMITYSCDEGYTLDGPATSVCQLNRTWTYDPPTCIGIMLWLFPSKNSFCFLVIVSLLIKVPARTPRDLWPTNLCKFWHTFQPIQIKYVKWNGNTNDVMLHVSNVVSIWRYFYFITVNLLSVVQL